MREITKSVLTLPWAVAMFGIQQVSNFVSPPPQGRAAGTSAAFDSVSHAAGSHLDGWLKRTYEMGDAVQRGIIDTAMLRPPSLDASTFMRMASEMQGGPLFQVAVNYVLPPIAWVSSFMVEGRDSAVAQQEFANKLHIIQLVTQVESQMGLDPSVHETVPSLIERADRFAAFPRLWAIEGIGNYYAERAWERTGGQDPRDLLTDGTTATLPSHSLTMLHAGIGMSFANRLLRTLTTDTPPEQVRATVGRFANLCRQSSRPGYTGAAYESLGLATRTLYPNFVAMIDRELPVCEPGLIGYFWHGVGRAIYFDPTTLLPAFNAPWRAVTKITKDAPHETAYLNMLSGLSWAITVVNMRNPEVMEAFLRHHGPTLASTPAFVDGMTSSLLMRFDTSPDDQNVAPFLRFQPADPAVAALWNGLIAKPGTTALSDSYLRLRQAGQLEHLFHFKA